MESKADFFSMFVGDAADFSILTSVYILKICANRFLRSVYEADAEEPHLG